MLALYLHFPYCIKKCPYCDFNSHIRRHSNYDEYMEALIQEISYYGLYYQNQPISSIFFGGGTPSLIPAHHIANILEVIGQYFTYDRAIEVTLESNPGTLERGMMADFKYAGINRISLGVQSLYNDDLKRLGRIHNSQNIYDAIDDVASNINNWSCDFIYARPWHDVTSWCVELETILTLKPKHISLYHLTIEEGTDYHRQHRLGLLHEHDEDTQHDFLYQTRAIIAKSPYYFYEISNASLPNYECQHNINYWRYGQWLGLGAGAHGRLCRNNIYYATQNYRLPEKYMQAVKNHAHGTEQELAIDEQQWRDEKIMMGLRLNQGIKSALCKKKHINTLISEGLLLQHDDTIKLTEQGIYVANKVIEYLL